MIRKIVVDRTQSFLLPPSLDDWVPPGHAARFIDNFVSTIDLEAIGIVVRNPETGRPRFSEDLLLRIWLYGWFERVRSCRALEKACERDIAFLWLSALEHPDHNTIWRFFRDNKGALGKLFKLVVQVAAKAGAVGLALHAIDGTKIRAACSNKTLLNEARLNERLEVVDKQINEFVTMIDTAQQNGELGAELPQALQNRQVCKQKIQESLAQLHEADRNEMHPGEPDARRMKMKEGNTAMGYNPQIVVDQKSDLIVAQDVVSDQNDQAQLVPMLDQVHNNLGTVAKTTVGDAGYDCGEELQRADDKHYSVLVNIGKAGKTQGDFSKGHFEFDPEKDVYRCPAGQVIPLSRICPPDKKNRHTRREYRCTHKDCPLRQECTKNPKGRTIQRTEGEEAVAHQIELQKDPANKALLKQRQQVVEHIFGVIKQIDGLRRFTVRGLLAVRAQWALACTVVNLRKLWALWRQGAFVMAT